MVQSPSGSKEKRRICVFCGSSVGNDPAYAQAAQRLGTLIGENEMDLVFGGGNVGLMGGVARAAHAAGADVRGVMPEFLRYLEPPLKEGETLEFTPDLQHRKARMLELADAFVILPGGLGTLDEFFEVVTSAQLGALKKPIVVLNTNGYFDPLCELISHVIRAGFAREDAAALYRFVATPDEAITAINSVARP